MALLGIGIAYAAAPGVVNTECIRRGIRTGFRPAFSVQAGALVGDCIWACVALAGVAAFSANESFAVALSLIGGLFLCRLATSAIRSALNGPAGGEHASSTGSMRTGLVFGLANPAGLAFWAGIGGGILSSRSSATTASDYLVFLLALLAGALCWSLGLSALVSWGGRYAHPRVFRVVDAICGAVLGIFGIRLL